MKYTDKNILKNALVSLQVLAIANCDEYLETLAERALEILMEIETDIMSE